MAFPLWRGQHRTPQLLLPPYTTYFDFNIHLVFLFLLFPLRSSKLIRFVASHPPNVLSVCTVWTPHVPLHKSATLNNRSLSPTLAPHCFNITLAFAFFGNPHGVRATWQQKAKAVEIEERVMGTDHCLNPRSFRSMFCGLPHTPLNIMKFVSIYYDLS